MFAFHSEYSLFLLYSSLSVSLLPPSLGGESLGGRGICEGIELPDQEAVSYVHNGLQHSFSVGVPA